MYQATEVRFGKRVRLLPFSTDGITTLLMKQESIPMTSPCRPVQDRSGSAVHGAGAALSGPHAELAGGPAKREEDAALVPRGPAHSSSGCILGLRPAQDKDGHFPSQVTITQRPSVEN